MLCIFEGYWPKMAEKTFISDSAVVLSLNLTKHECIDQKYNLQVQLLYWICYHLIQHRVSVDECFLEDEDDPSQEKREGPHGGRPQRSGKASG